MLYTVSTFTNHSLRISTKQPHDIEHLKLSRKKKKNNDTFGSIVMVMNVLPRFKEQIA